LSLLNFLPLAYHHSHFLAATLDFTSFFTTAFLGATHFFTAGLFLDLIKTHGSVLCSPRSHHVTPWVYWQEDKECNFHTYAALRSLTQIQPNLLLRCPQTRWIYIPNHTNQSRNMNKQSFEIISSFFSSSFCTLCIFGHNLRMHTPIQLKLKTLRYTK